MDGSLSADPRDHAQCGGLGAYRVEELGHPKVKAFGKSERRCDELFNSKVDWPCGHMLQPDVYDMDH